MGSAGAKWNLCPLSPGVYTEQQADLSGKVEGLI